MQYDSDSVEARAIEAWAHGHQDWKKRNDELHAAEKAIDAHVNDAEGKSAAEFCKELRNLIQRRESAYQALLSTEERLQKACEKEMKKPPEQ